MPTTLSSLQETWTAATDFDSAVAKFLVVLATGALGFVVSLQLSELWEQLLGYYSSVATYSTGMVVFLGLYFGLGYAVTTVRERQP
ncbi:hypothetical protein [Halomicrococcus gelatinilyticus]|uniref:hypothetical protein n=1 Tax=Halomicrococcus gelatinilyticus TaxID=1702103 RepID=UPI002E13FBC1